MNKIILGIVTIGLSGALSAEDAVIVLESFNLHGKNIVRDVIVMSKNEVLVNKEKLTNTEIITQSEHLKNLSTFPKNVDKEQCGVGVFKHTFKKGKLKKVENGCIGSPRHKFLKASFQNLKKDKITE